MGIIDATAPSGYDENKFPATKPPAEPQTPEAEQKPAAALTAMEESETDATTVPPRRPTIRSS